MTIANSYIVNIIYVYLQPQRKKEITIDTIELFQQLLRFKSITPDDDGAFDFLESYLDDFEVIKVDKNGIKNRLFYKTFQNDTTAPHQHFCFGGHIDVVPPGEHWDSDPFEPVIKGDTITARGTQDMKSGVCAFIQATKKFVEEIIQQPLPKNANFTVSLLLTSDEEGEGKYGTLEMLKHLKAIDFLPHFGVVTEPTCQEQFGDAIKIGRRGSINGKLILRGKQGHAAYPQKAINPIHQIAPILSQIAGFEFDQGDEHFDKSQLIITDMRSGMEVTNVTPHDLKIMFNVRNSPQTTKEDIQALIAEKFKGLDVSYELVQNAYPFKTNTNSLLVQKMVNAIEQKTSIRPKLSTDGGTSDARFFGEFGIDTVEFGVKNDKIHAVNESTSLKDVLLLEDIFSQLIKSLML